MDYKKIKKATNRLDWLEQRRTLGIGGSECSAAIGLSTTFMSPISLWTIKRGIKKQEDISSFERIEWGNRAEDMIAQAFIDKHPECKVKKNNFILQSKKYPYMIADLDREGVDINGKKFVLEIKNVSEFMKREWVDDEMPISYELQVLHYLIVTGYDYGVIAALVGGNKYIERTVVLDEETKQRIVSAEFDFWCQVQNDEMPEPDGSESSGETIKELYPESDPSLEIQLTNEYDQMLKRYLEINDQIKLLTKEQDNLKQNIQFAMKTCEKAQTESYSVSWKSYSTNRVDAKFIEIQYPEVYREALRETSSRRFTTKIKKGE